MENVLLRGGKAVVAVDVGWEINGHVKWPLGFGIQMIVAFPAIVAISASKYENGIWGQPNETQKRKGMMERIYYTADHTFM